MQLHKDLFPGWEGTRASFAGLLALEPMVRRTLSAAVTVAETSPGDPLAVWRVEQPRLITSLARMLRGSPLAEDLAQEALLAALAERWPGDRRSEKRLGARWLMATAKRRALDHLRRGPMLLERTHEAIARDMVEEQQAMPDWDPHWTTT